MTNLPQPSAHVIATAFDNGEGVLIDLHGKRYFQLNETALLIWQGLEAGHSSEQILAKMMTEYEVTEPQAQQSLWRLIGDLQKQELLAMERGASAT
jgi:hypothetical protein